MVLFLAKFRNTNVAIRIALTPEQITHLIPSDTWSWSSHDDAIESRCTAHIHILTGDVRGDGRWTGPAWTLVKHIGLDVRGVFHSGRDDACGGSGLDTLDLLRVAVGLGCGCCGTCGGGGNDIEQGYTQDTPS